MDSNTLDPRLFPPLDEDSEDVISPELKSKFDRLRALLPNTDNPRSAETVAHHEDRKRKQVDCPSTGKTEFEQANKIMVKKARANKSEIGCSDDGAAKHERLLLATETYAAIESEISLMRNGIRELEALLDRTSGNDVALSNVEDKPLGEDMVVVHRDCSS